MAELVDAQVSGTCDRFGRGSSSLLQGTKNTSLAEVFLCPQKRFSNFHFIVIARKSQIFVAIHAN